MSYSAFFTAGLSLASRPRSDSIDDPHALPLPQINVHPSTPRAGTPRLRRRRSSLTLATSPMAAVKSPMRSANDAVRTAMRSPSHSSLSLMEALQAAKPASDSSGAIRPKMARRKTVSSMQEMQTNTRGPAFPAPTAPLPPLPALLPTLSTSALPSPTIETPTDQMFSSSSPIMVDPVLPSLRSNPARRSSSALPPPNTRGPFTSSTFSNMDMGMLMEEKDVVYLSSGDETMKEN
ncbi:hypothetical protein M422DRAFT_51794 [Sphaerobolus stellatus SS14]|uniref:Uncharacterized protein n=1 Tax=Sphaerobolus stellatus (strain SS14) TaxID=990650 RepID=A0A0C9TWT2_SPHS4|nr:hypothetical protein M422DRAFT_51794 [Sphaerobolus stellatus SS14]